MDEVEMDYRLNRLLIVGAILLSLAAIIWG